MPEINLDGVYLQFDDGRRRMPVLDNLTLTAAAGEFVSLVGPSGCGKSTILSLLAGLRRPDVGSVVVDGLEVRGPSPDRGVVFQEYALFPWMTVQQNIVFALEQVARGEHRQRVRQLASEWVDLLGLSEFAASYPGQLSGGMRQRVALARAFAVRPRLLLLDEPFAALDALTRLFLQEVLLGLWEEHRPTVVMVTHDVDEALLLSDRILVMTPRPTRVKQEIPVYFARPRRREALLGDEDYAALKAELLHLLRDEMTLDRTEQAGKLRVIKQGLGRETA